MQDINGTELKIGQKAVFSVSTKLVLGTISGIRERQYGERTLPIITLTLKNPERRFERGQYIREGGDLFFVQGPELAPRTVRKIYDLSRILVLDNSEK